MKRKRARYRAVTQKDIDQVKMLHNTQEFSVTGIAKILRRSWTTIDNIIQSGFEFKEYQKLTKQYNINKNNAAKANKVKKLRFTPFGGEISDTQPTTIEPTILDKMAEKQKMLNDAWEEQQAEAKAIVRKAERKEAIHKLRDGMQMISEGLGALL